MMNNSFSLNLSIKMFVLIRFTQNFGVLGVLDRLHGTDTQFRKSLAYKRHFLLLSLVPVTQQIPNPPKNGKLDSPCHSKAE